MRGSSESLRFSGAWLYLGAALMLALLAGFAVYSFLHAAVPTGAVFTVTRDLPPGTQITEQDLTTKQIPAVARPEGAMEKKDEIVGQRIRFGLAAGDIIRKTHLAPAANSEIPQKVAAMGDTYRAVMIASELVPGKAKLVPGDQLELLAVMQAQDGSKSTMRLMEVGKATVLENPKAASGDSSTLLIALRSDAVARYALAQRTGTIVVAVPGQGMTDSVPALKLEDLTGSAPTAAPAATPAATPTSTTAAKPAATQPAASAQPQAKAPGR